MIGGLGTSLLFTPCISAPAHYFNRRRGLASGIASAGGACGGIAFPLLMQALIPKLGFIWTTRIMEIIMFVFLVIANLLIRTRLPRSSKFQTPHPDLRILSAPAFSMTVAGVFLLELGVFIPLIYVTSYARNEDYSYNFAYQILPIINVGSAFGRPIPGFLADKVGYYNTIIFFTIVTILSILLCWLPFGRSPGALVMFALLFGFSSGCNISLTPACIGLLCDTRDYGRYYATCYTIVSFGCLIGIPIAGLILESSGYQYWSLIVWTGCCYGYALIAFVVARGLGGGWKLRKLY
jgi:MFS family permease